MVDKCSKILGEATIYHCNRTAKVEVDGKKYCRQHGNIEQKKSNSIVCPFCVEGDFDLIGLKLHLEQGWCNGFEKLDTSSIKLLL